MPAARVLVVEDEATMADVVARYLRRDGHEVRVVGDGLEAVAAYQEFHPDLLVLDLMLPGIDGFEVVRRIRRVAETPVIMLTARADEMDRLLGFGLGADDYVVKPFSPRELAARVQAVLRRSSQESSSAAADLLRYGDLRINALQRTATTAGGEVDLTAREFDLLLHIARHPSQVFTREQLIDAVWDRDAVTDVNAVTVHIRRIRAKLEEDASRPRYIKTVWGIGYKFEP
jgi:two-component system, OmpR family, response regulator ResD